MKGCGWAPIKLKPWNRQQSQFGLGGRMYTLPLGWPCIWKHFLSLHPLTPFSPTSFTSAAYRGYLHNTHLEPSFYKYTQFFLVKYGKHQSTHIEHLLWIKLGGGGSGLNPKIFNFSRTSHSIWRNGVNTANDNSYLRGNGKLTKWGVLITWILTIALSAVQKTCKGVAAWFIASS